MNEIFEIKDIENGQGTYISNHSNYKCLISLKPVYPKRKHILIMVVPSKTFKIIEEKLDITKISIAFE